MQRCKYKDDFVVAARGEACARDDRITGAEVLPFLHRYRALLACVLIACFASMASGQVTLYGAGSPVRLDSEGRPAGWHAWFMVLDQASTPSDSSVPARSRAMLLHVPPSTAFAPRQELGGMARQLAALDFAYSTPHIGAALNRVYLAVEGRAIVAGTAGSASSVEGQSFPPVPKPATRVIAIPTAFAEGQWLNLAGAPEDLRVLQADRRIVSFAVCEVGPVALLAPGGRGLERVSTYDLMVLPSGLNQSWRKVTLPPFSDVSRMSLTGANDVLVAFEPATDADLPRCAIGRVVQRDLAGPPAPVKLGGNGQVPSVVEVDWREVALPEWEELGRQPQFAITRWGIIAATIVLEENESGECGLLEAWVLDPLAKAGQWRLLARHVVQVSDDVARDQNFAVAMLDGEDALVVAWAPGEKQIARGEDAWTKLGQAMISTTTGRLIEEGPLTLISPVTAHDYRMIGALVAWVVGLVTLVLVRPPASEYRLSLPEDVALAEPLRRLVAGFIDFGFAMIVGGFVAGNSLDDLVGMDVGELLLTQQGHLTVLAILGVGFVIGSVGEFMFGRSPGKAIAGCFVVKADGGESHVSRGSEQAGSKAGSQSSEQAESSNSVNVQNEQEKRDGATSGEHMNAAGGSSDELMYPSLPEAMLRNFIKWFLPPAALAGVWREGGRHRGEQYTGTAVVLEVEDEWDENV